VLVAGILGVIAMKGGGSKQPAASVGSAESGSGSSSTTAVAKTPEIGSAAPVSTTGSASAGSAVTASGSAALETGSATSAVVDAHSKTKPGATKHHTEHTTTDKTVPHDKAVPHTVETTPKPEGPKPPDPAKSGSAALPF
jgi:hypothetical protein